MNAVNLDGRLLIHSFVLAATCLLQLPVECVDCRARALAPSRSLLPLAQPGFLTRPSRPSPQRLLGARALPPTAHGTDVPSTYSEQVDYYEEHLRSQAPKPGSRYYILAIETSCDDACAAILSSDGDILAEERAGNPESLIKFGGIKPDELYRFHLEHLGSIIDRVVANAGVRMADVKRIAVTRGPGMTICLKAGYDAAAEISTRYGIPLVAENHLAGHCLSPFIKGHQFGISAGGDAHPSQELRYPFLSLLLSGGHSQIYVVEGPAKFHMLTDTMDTYAGNVLYKCAKELGLPISNGGGPSLEEAARKARGDPIFSMTEPCKDMAFTSFCFSGVHTQLRAMLARLRKEYGQDVTTKNPDVVNHLAYTCQEIVFQQVLRQLNKALDICDSLFGIDQLVVVGGKLLLRFSTLCAGVSCNERLRELIADLLRKRADSAGSRIRAFATRMYGNVKKAWPLKDFERNDADENILVRNLVDRMRGVRELPELLRLLWSHDLYPDLLQRREGIHLSVQHKNALYSALMQAYLSLLSDTEAYHLHRNLLDKSREREVDLQPDPRVLEELVNLERQQRSSLIAGRRHAKEEKREWQLFTTSGKYCTDNAVMVAHSLLEKHRAGLDGIPGSVFEHRVVDQWDLASRRHWEMLSNIALLHSLTHD
ncbi:glycoprotease family protein, putative [Babesia bigemina]|uniref:N(6)-L-threonylcarbamoyladenine synthase n=1 Tax=Babesia bigemina TaxID=5866 RepID=A0A061DEJ9_BABBI|nr:glycoprotease family protein, putative [Babesia bigemina]CDR97410.1 glycoprotease family protein, putative [Babesia bigemina]|eukprot:XP_012769596.1 glycoprotease family protein, putative [Babesia bigemina]